MKKAVLLLLMVTIIAGCIYLKNADKDTVLYPLQTEEEQDVPVHQAESTEESISETATIEETISEPETEEITQKESLPETSPQEEETDAVADEVKIAGVIYERLTEAEQKIYAEILNALLTFEKGTVLSTTDAGVIDKAFSAVMLDNPGIFYVDGYKYTEYARDDKVERIEFTGKYLYEEEEILRRQELIEAKVSDILARMPDTRDEYHKVKYLYDTLVTQTEYDLQAPDNQNICSVFIGGKSVCQGYAKALQYLANKAGINCSLVLGDVIGGDAHAWNLISVNGAWYYLDATWGDAFYLFGNQEQVVKKQSSVINYDYMCVTTEQLSLTHNSDMPVELPDCVSVADNYFVREGLYFTGYDAQRLSDIFSQAIAKGQETVTFKCSDKAVFDELYRILLDEQKVFEFLNSEGTVAYTDNATQGIFTFWLFEGRY